MGRTDLRKSSCNDDDKSDWPAAALLAFPSPASITGSLMSPGLTHDSADASTYLTSSNSYEHVGFANAIAEMPDDVCITKAETPMAEMGVDPAMKHLDDSLTTLPFHTPPVVPGVLDRPGLRLPSFQQLGIAAPHPDNLSRKGGYFPLHGVQEPEVGLGAPSDRIDSVNERAKVDLPRMDAQAIRSPIFHCVSTITPPMEAGPIPWDPRYVQTVGMHSPPTNLDTSPVHEEQIAGVVSSEHTDRALPRIQRSLADDAGGGSRNSLWIDDAIETLVESLGMNHRPADSLRVLSHALPSTSTSGHMFTHIIKAISASTPTSPLTPMTWINVFHAIPGRFNLADLPTSPPETPGPAIGGDDYFTQKTFFDSAVSISDYQEDLSSLPRSPRPVVPPSSIDVSIVERYIPSSTSNEFAEMFDPNGSSILVDRMVELSPNNGSLLFVYPTKKGGQTFMRDYLGPILDPLLRTMVVVHGLSTDMCTSIGGMSAVRKLLDHETLHRCISALCAQLTQQDTAAQRFHGRRPAFTLAYASKQDVKLNRAVWAREWWTRQEKTRIKQILANHSREADTRREPQGRRTSMDFAPQAATSAVLLRDLLDRVAGNDRQASETPEAGIEVSVFVIRRSR